MGTRSSFMRTNLDQGVPLLPAECCGPCAGILLLLLLLVSSLPVFVTPVTCYRSFPSLLCFSPSRAPHCLLAKALWRDLKVVGSNNFGHDTVHILPSLQVILLLGSCIKYCVRWLPLARASNILMTSRVTDSLGCLGIPYHPSGHRSNDSVP